MWGSAVNSLESVHGECIGLCPVSCRINDILELGYVVYTFLVRLSGWQAAVVGDRLCDM